MSPLVLSARHVSLVALCLGALALLASTGCLLEVVEGNGVEVTEQRSLTSSTQLARIEVSSGTIHTVDVYVCDCEQIRIRGDENLISHVETRREGSTLEIETEGWLTPQVPLVVEVYTRYVDEIASSGSSNLRVIDLSGGKLLVETSGSSDVKLKGKLELLEIETSGSSDVDIVELEARDIRVSTSGSSDIELVGEASTLEVRTTGSSDVDASELLVRDVTIETSGSSDVDVCVTGTLDVSISGSGDVTYGCDPERVTRAISGSGDVRSR